MLRRYFSTSVLLLTVLLVACSEGDSSGGQASPETSGTVEATGTAGPTSTPTISLTPRPEASADAPAAERLEAQGDLRRAYEAYLSVASPTSQRGIDALLGAARVLLEMEHAEEARALLEPFVRAGNTPAAAHYLLARSLAALGQTDLALQHYAVYIQSGRPAAPYASLDRARLLLESSPGAAAVEAQQAYVSGLAPIRPTAIFLTAQAYERAGNISEALRWYQTMLDYTPPLDRPLALFRIATLKKLGGDTTYVADLQRILASYPATGQAQIALNELESTGQAVDPYLRGLVYYRHNDYSKAQPAFEEKIAAAPEGRASAEAYYYLAAIKESQGDLATAISMYTKVLSLNPGSGVAPDSIWWRARLLEDDGKHNEANALYAQLARDYPLSGWAKEAGFRHGLVAYRAGRYSEAASAWQDAAGQTTDATERDRLTLWRAKASQKAGDSQGARALLDPLATAGEDDYYGVRALTLLKGPASQPRATRESKVDLAPAFDWPAAEAWLTAKVGLPIGDSANQPWMQDERWTRALELWTVGRNSQAEAEVWDLLETNAGNPIAMYTMARVLDSKGRTSLSARAGQRLLRIVNTNPNAGLPKALLSLSYPAAFADAVKRAADTERISPLLMLAFVRQESFFDPRAESGVGAIGLTQVMPDTARSVAGRLGIGDYAQERLIEPELNLRLGASYMADQVKSFGNEIFVAFAAYNAGPNAARRWSKTAGDEADLFLENVEFRETRLYVEIVAENYAIYRYLYAGEPAPNLP